MLPLLAREDLGAMVMKWLSTFSKAPALLGASDCLISYPGHSLVVGSVYSTVPAFLANKEWSLSINYRNTKEKVRSPDGDTEYFVIVAGVLQGDTLAPHLFIICLDYVLRTSIDLLIKSEKTASNWQRKEAEVTPQKQLPTPTTPMT